MSAQPVESPAAKPAGGFGDTVRLGAILMLVSAISAGALSLTYAATKDRIETQLRLEEKKGSMASLPGVRAPGDLRELTAPRRRAAVAYPDLRRVYVGRRGARLVGHAVQVAPRGFGGPITMAVGISPDGEVLRVVVVDHKETPALGSNVAQTHWLAQFAGKDPDDALVVGRDVDAVTGATRSSRATAQGVRDALAIWRRYLADR